MFSGVSGIEGITGDNILEGSIPMGDLEVPVQKIIRPGWADLLAPVAVRGTGGSAPTWAQVDSTAFWNFRFAVGNEFWTDFHINHDYLPDGDVHLHVHWFTNGTSTQPVVWQMTYAIAKGHQQGDDSLFPLASPTVVTVSKAPTGLGAYEHIVSEMDNSIIKTLLEPDTIIKCHFRRITNGGTDNANNVFGLMADCHYEVGMMCTPRKEPDFYAEV
jgi:hypothetical protein